MQGNSGAARFYLPLCREFGGPRPPGRGRSETDRDLHPTRLASLATSLPVKRRDWQTNDASPFFGAKNFFYPPAPRNSQSPPSIVSSGPKRQGDLASDETDGELAKRAASGDRAAFAALAERHYDRVYTLAWRWSGARAEAQDIAQDAMEKLATAMTTFREDCAFTTWAYRIAYTTAIDHIRARQKIVPLDPAQMATFVDEPAADTPEDEIAGQELWRAVRALPGQQRDAVLLVYAQDMSHGEAAALMGCSEKTVSWHLHEARKRLKNALEVV